MAVLDDVKTNVGTSAELLQLFRRKKRLWLIPMVLVLLVFSVMFIIFAEASAVAPFIYSLF